MAIESGAYKKHGDTDGSASALECAQQQPKVHVGGKSAIELARKTGNVPKVVEIKKGALHNDLT